MPPQRGKGKSDRIEIILAKNGAKIDLAMNIHILNNKKFINVEFTGNWDIAGLRPTGFFLWLRPSLQRYLVARSGLRLLRLLSTESKLRPFGLKNPFERKADILSALTFALRAKQRPVFDGSSLMRG